MKQCGLTARRLRAAANVDPKTLRGLLDGSRWPQEDTRLKIEMALDWEAGSIEDIHEGRSPTPIESKPASPLKIVSDDDLLAELAERLRLARGVVVGQQSQDLPFGTPGGWRHAPVEEAGVLGNHDTEKRRQSGR